MQFANRNGLLVIDDISKDELDIDKTFNCGQTFRWHKLPSGKWYGVVDSKIVVMYQEENSITTNLVFDPNTSNSWLLNYLNLDTNYAEEMSKIDLESDEYLRKAYNAGKGIHILRQDLYETIITFIISQMNSMNNIRNCVANLSKVFGNKISTSIDGKIIEDYTFPTPEALAYADYEALRTCKVGFRADYIQDISEFIADIPTFLPDLREAKYSTAMKMLKNFKGIGDKVANCICLFSLHHVGAFPIDTHIKQIADKHYGGHIDTRKYGNIAGIVQQYMFYYKALQKGE